MHPDQARPDPSAGLTGDELLRWYWLKEELADLARSLGVRTTGSKEVLTRRLAAALDGRPFTEPASTRRGDDAQLRPPLTATTVIPRGQRCSQVVRAFLVEHLGESFVFDGEMRAFFARTDGSQTLQDALDHFHATRDQGRKAIGPQFEYNRFTRAWHEEHPHGSQDELRAAWGEYRSRPTDERGRV